MTGAVGRLVRHVARVLGSLGMWAVRRRHGVRSGDRAFGYTAPETATTYGIAFVCAVETAGMYLLLPSWPIVHAVVLVLDLATLVLVLGLHTASVTRPHVITPDTLRVRRGAHVDLVLPLARIVSVRRELRFTAPGAAQEDGVLELAVGAQTSVTVELDESATYVRLLGGRRQVRTVRFHADDAPGLVAALTQARTGPSPCPGRPG
ncbi:hypothetical protein [Streptomyces sp. CBMA152]|uniref:hypothetical protein n=1 Tax=Streptomyces sp. CBMA152 TaxID=1896312 RepID=UPI001660C127|nr:hypothetical protein [Streptomyces sp. CBMA152]MBD0747059.1 hypothetical protein [Streptomyces sp. CBMA152]